MRYQEISRPMRLQGRRRVVEGVAGIRAFHGSPHDFAEFDTVAIGTGEGAQAFGHGMYFADSEQLAAGYRDRLSGDQGGYMYEVRLMVDPAELLHWDAFLHQQSPAVQAAVETILKAEPGGLDVIWLDPGNGTEINLTEMEPDERRVIERSLGKMKYGYIRPRWEHILQTMSPQKMALGDDPVAASEKLLHAGIPGIKYLDGFSRELGDGSYNYVMFDLSLVKVIRKY